MATCSYTVQLPAGTNKDVPLNIGYPGSWPGAIYIHFSSGVAWTLTRCDIMVPPPVFATPKVRQLVTGPTAVAQFYRLGWFLRWGECVINLRYTSSMDVSFNMESNTAVKPDLNP